MSPGPGRFKRACGWLCAGDWVLKGLYLFLALYFVATPGIFQGKASGDGLVDFLYLPSVFVHHTLDMREAIGETNSGWRLPIVNDRMPNTKSVGPPLAWAPFFAVGLAIEGAISRVRGGPLWSPLGNNVFSYWVCGLATLLYGLLGIRLLYGLLLRRYDRSAARTGVVAAALATPCAWYLLHQPTYQHGMTFFTTALLIERWEKWRSAPTIGRYAALGAIGGLGMLMRVQEVAFLLLPATDLIVAGVGSLRVRSWGRLKLATLGAVMLGVTALVVFLPQWLIWYRDYGGARETPQAALGYFRWRSPAFVGLLFSSRAGFFYWSPVAYLSAVGLLVGRRRLGLFGLGLLAVFFIELYINACVLDWWGQWSYGARRLSDQTVLLGIGIAALWSQIGHGRPRLLRGVAALLALMVLFNLAAMELVRQRKMPSSGGGAMGAWERLKQIGTPDLVWQTVRRVGWPTAWPASIPFALYHRAPISTFEEIYGYYFLERAYNEKTERAAVNIDNDVLIVKDKSFDRFRMNGFDSATRFLLPFFSHEPIRVQLSGDLDLAGTEIRWNGVKISAIKQADSSSWFDLPRRLVNMGINELQLAIPSGELSQIQFRAN